MWREIEKWPREAGRDNENQVPVWISVGSTSYLADDLQNLINISPNLSHEQKSFEAPNREPSKSAGGNAIVIAVVVLHRHWSSLRFSRINYILMRGNVLACRKGSSWMARYGRGESLVWFVKFRRDASIDENAVSQTVSRSSVCRFKVQFDSRYRVGIF